MTACGFIGPRKSDDGTAKKQSRFRAVFYSIRRRCPKIESPAPPVVRHDSGGNKTLPERTKGRQRGQRIVSGGKSRPARRVESKTGRGESISSAGIFVRNRRKSVCRSVCTCRFDGRKRLQYLRAVGLRPDSNDFRMQPYTPYAVPLKGKRPKRSNSQKRCIKCIRLFACPLSPTLHWLFARAEKMHTDCIRLHTKCIRNA